MEKISERFKLFSTNFADYIYKPKFLLNFSLTILSVIFSVIFFSFTGSEKVNAVAPTATITKNTGQADPVDTNGTYRMSWQITFNQAIVPGTFSTSDITMSGTGGTKAGWTPYTLTTTNNIVWVYSINPGFDGTYIPTLTAGSVTNLTNEGNTIAIGPSITKTCLGSPNCLLSAPWFYTTNSSPTNSGTLTWKICQNYGAPIDPTNFSTASFTNSGTGKNWTYNSYQEVIPSTCSEKEFLVNFNSGTDGTYLMHGAATLKSIDGFTYPVGNSEENKYNTTTITLDRTAPTVTVEKGATQADPTTGGTTINYSVTLSEAPVGLTLSDFRLTGTGTGGSLGGLTQLTSTTYNVSVNQGSDGTYILDLPAGSFTDAAGNGNTVSTSNDNNVRVEKGVPTVTINQATGQSDPQYNTGPINYTIVFSEDINPASFTIAAGDITLPNCSGISAGTLTTTDNKTWTLAVNASQSAANCNVNPTIAASKVTDLAGKNNTASTSTDNTVTFIPPGYTATYSATTINENAGTATINVKLNTPVQTGKNAIVKFSLDSTTNATLSASSLTFTSTNWSTNQSITITGVNDFVDSIVNDTASLSIMVDSISSTDTNYAAVVALPGGTIFTFTDDDVAGTTVSASTLTIAEAAGTGTFTIKLNSQPIAGTVVKINLTSGSTADGTVSPSSITFDDTNWNTIGAFNTVTVTGVNDSVDTVANDTSTITIAIDTTGTGTTDAQYKLLANKTVVATFTDDDTASYTVSKTTATAAENAGTDTFTVVLNTQPITGTQVVFNVTSGSTADGTVSAPKLTFTPTGTTAWNVPQTITITGVNDNVDSVANDTSTITVSIDTTATTGTTDTQYKLLTSKIVVATFTDDDTAGYTVSKTTATAGENAGTDTFTVVLNTQPIGTTQVVFNVTSSSTADGTVSPAKLTFTPTGTTAWNLPQTVTITGVNDNVDSVADDTSTITVAIDITATTGTTDTQYKVLTSKTLAATFTDDDTAGFTISKTTATAGENAGTDTFTVVLNTQPIASTQVILNVASSSTADGRVSPAKLTFTPTGTTAWNLPQTVTITGVNDNVDSVANDTSNITVTIDTTATTGTTDAQYKALTGGAASKTVVTTFTDDDTAGFTVSKTTTTISENPGSDTFTVVLNTQPIALQTVKLTVTSSSTADATVSSSLLTFTPTGTTAWNLPQTVTINAVNDNVDTVANDTSTISVAIDTVNTTDAQYKLLTTPNNPKTILATFTDDDNAGFTLSKTTATAGENGGTDTFTVVLNTQPIANTSVKFTLSSSSTADGTVSVTNPPLTFTPADWNTAKTVTITGVNDSVDSVADDTSTITVAIDTTPTTGTTDTQYAGLTTTNASKTVLATFTDDDTAGFTVSTTSLTIGENGGTGTFTVKPNTQPIANTVVKFAITSSATGEGTVSSSLLTFDPNNWNTAQSVTVTGVNDNTDSAANDTSTISISIDTTATTGTTDPKYKAITAPNNSKSITATFTDDDTAGFTISATSLTVPENAGTGTYTVVLNTMPIATKTVTFDFTSGTTANGTISPSTFTFDTTNWNTPKVITVTGVNDNIDTPADETSVITTAIKNTTTDSQYFALTGANASKTFTATFTDDDQPGLTLSTTTVTAGENAGTATFTVKPNTQPQTGKVIVVKATSANTSEGTVSPASWSFDSTNWATAQAFTVTGVNDYTDSVSNDTALINLTIDTTATNIDSQYSSSAATIATSVTATFTDDDTAGFTLSKTSMAVGENAGTNTFTVVLNTQPIVNMNVKFTLVSSSTADGTVSVASPPLTFTSADWNTPKAVTVTGVDDLIDTPSDETSTITVAIDGTSTTDAQFKALTGANASKTVLTTFTDNDTAGITLSATTLTVGENGGIGTFTAKLNTQPQSNVVLSITSGDTNQGTVTPATLTFTPANWNNAQGVTVTGVNDQADSINDDTANISVSVVDASSDNQYDPLSDLTVATTFTDDDAAGITLSKSNLSVGENGGTGTFTAVLNAQPLSNVVLSVTSSDTTQGTVLPATITFTSTDWNIAKIITVTGVDDTVDTPTDDTGNIVVSVVDASSYDTFDPLADKTVAITYIDDDQAGLNVSKSTMAIGENAGKGTFTVKLNTKPTSNVVVSVVSSDTTQGTVDLPLLTFTSLNWNIAQTVTITGVDDPADTILDDTSNITVSVVDASSDDTYDPVADQTVAMTYNDDDIASLVVSASTLVVGENAGTNTFTIKLGAQPMSDVVLNLSISDNTQGTLSDSTVTFTNANWNTAKTITVTGVNDQTDTANDDTANVTISVLDASSYDTFDPLSDKTVAVTFTDDDIAGYSLSATSLNVGENAGTGTFTVVLNTKPISDVVFAISSGTVSNGTVSPAAMTFTGANWNTPQTITVTGVNDFVDTPSDETSIITVALDKSLTGTQDSIYKVLTGSNASKTATATFTDDDTAGINLSKTSLSIAENAGTGTFTVTLNSQPQTNVVINISSSATTEGTVLPTSLTFTPANWNSTQNVTVTGVNDNINTPTDSTSNIILTIVDASSDDQYDPLSDKTLVATFIDDDQPGFTTTIVDGTTGEDGSTGSFKIHMNSQPTANVTIALSSSNTGEGTVSSTSVTFTPTNWNIDQTVTVTGVNDNPPVADGSVAYNIITGDVTSADAQYDALDGSTVADVQFVNDNDDPPGITATLTGFTTEAGGIATVAFKLLTQPTASVTIPLSISDSTEGSLTVTSITITTANWNANTNVVTITGVDDFIVDGNISYQLVTGDPTSADAGYEALTAANVADLTIVNNDNDVAGVTITPSGSTTDVTEGGATDSYGIKLTSQPAFDVVVTVTTGSQVSASPLTLTFTPLNWNIDQNVTVTATDDNRAEGPHTELITHSATSTDSLYNGISINNVTVNITDNDPAEFTISKTSSTISENAGTDSFTVVLTSQPNTDVVMNVTSSSTADATISPQQITFTSLNWNQAQTITMNAVDDLIDTPTNDTATIKVAVDDPSSNDLFDTAIDKTLSLTLTDDDSSGIIVSANTLSVGENAGTGSFTVKLGTIPQTNVVLNLISSSTTDATVAPATLTFTNANWNVEQTVTVTGVNDNIVNNPAENVNITVSVDDPNSDNSYDPLEDLTVVVTLVNEDIDTDGDGIINTLDQDIDGDGIPNDQDPDIDGDGVNNVFDQDIDGDGVPNNTDSDDDGDSIRDATDPTPNGLGSLTDIDGDGIPNEQDPDIDGDGIVNFSDPDIDGDGIPNNLDTDDDGDGIPDATDNSPNGVGTNNDLDGDGIPNEQDPDIDGDGINNIFDDDIDGDGIPNDLDTDDDGDGVLDNTDPTPNGLGSTDDIDGDGIPNNIDTDIDGDGIPNEQDDDIDGDGIPNEIDTDDDGDGILDNVDDTPNGPLANDPDGDGISTTDENIAPNKDGNGDSIEDGIQVQVSTRYNPVTKAYTTLEISEECGIINGYKINGETEMSTSDNSYDYPLGIFGFKLKCKLPGSTATAKFYFDKVYDTTNFKFRKFNSITKTYADLSSFVSYNVQKVNGIDVTIAEIKVTDGGLGDEDGIANGEIKDPSGPAQTVVLSKTGNEINIIMILSIIILMVKAIKFRKELFDNY